MSSILYFRGLLVNHSAEMFCKVLYRLYLFLLGIAYSWWSPL